MSFLYPLGLLALIGVPILIIIYIIKNKYTEQTVTSTYIWTLSEKFLKRRNPINKLQKWISLVLQILAVMTVSFAIAHPTFALAGKANDYCFVLDGSGSMSATVDGTTRFDRAKQNITDIINESGNGSSYTLVCAGETSDVIFRDITDKAQAIRLLEETQTSGTQVDYTDALGEAQKYFDAMPYAKIYFLTDCDYASSDNVQVLNVASNEVNFGLLSAECELSDSTLKVKGKAIAHGGGGQRTISVYINDSTVPAGKTRVLVNKIEDTVNVSADSETINALMLENATDFVVQCSSVNDYQSVRIVIDEEDAIASDNEYVLYNVKHDTSFNTLIVSDRPFFLKSILQALGHRQITVMETKDYNDRAAMGLSYGLYIFDSFTPNELPSNGAVWMFAPSQTVANSGFAYQQPDSDTPSPKKLDYSASTKSEIKKLLNGLDMSEEMYISQYIKYSTSMDFLSLILYNGDPVVFAGSNGYGNREVVFAYSLNDSDMPLCFNYIKLFDNLLNYTFPQVVEEANYTSGETLKINVLANTQSIVVTSPSGEDSYLSTESSECLFDLNEVGLYTIKVCTGSGNNVAERTFAVYSQMPYAEGATLATAESFSVVGEPAAGGRDGIYDNLLALFIILAVFFIADWMVYCYEQYQLR